MLVITTDPLRLNLVKPNDVTICLRQDILWLNVQSLWWKMKETLGNEQGVGKGRRDVRASVLC